ncbi:MAG TPA: heavy metal transporter [Ruminiclostridium sp.]|mgnify:CR=1 FL=1|jgi:cation transport ATPase|nr:heavy metal transporter [Ruminiclostridium sp.]
MKKTFLLEGLDCANCAAKMEKAINALDGVSRATVNFMTTKLVIEGEDEKMAGIIEAAKKVVKNTEPDVVMKKA